MEEQYLHCSIPISNQSSSYLPYLVQVLHGGLGGIRACESASFFTSIDCGPHLAPGFNGHDSATSFVFISRLQPHKIQSPFSLYGQLLQISIRSFAKSLTFILLCSCNRTPVFLRAIASC